MKHWRILLAAASLVLGCTTSAPQVAGPPHSDQLLQEEQEAPPAKLASFPAPMDPGGVGSLETRTELGETGYLRLQKVTVEAVQAGDVAAVSASHLFVNESDATLEGTFRFPMPDGAVLTGLAMMVNGKLVEGELLENHRAQRIYEEIVDAMQDPALLQWDQGSIFKLRVFPIEPRDQKLVVMRYLVPLRRTEAGFAFAQGTRAASVGEAIPELELRWQGQQAVLERDVAPGRVFELRADMPNPVLHESRDGEDFAVVRIQPDFAKVPVSSARAPRDWIVVVDTSRSSLEERPLALEACRTVLEGLAPSSRFTVATLDLELRVDPRGLVPRTADNIEQALRYVEGVTPDGATDLSALIAGLADLARGRSDMAVVYIGDGEPSWGETNASRLRDHAARALPRTPVNLLLLGASVNQDVARELALATPARVLRARRLDDVKGFASSLGAPSKRLLDAELVQVPGAVVLPTGKLMLEDGDEVLAYVRAERGSTLPTSITLRANVHGKTLDTVVPLASQPERFVAQRFGAEWLRELDRAGKPKAEIVEASLAYGVMSKHTSFLVLESEEAYARYDIARRQRVDGASAHPPRIRGLETLDDPTATISLNRIQPGDPEILIDAPPDARRVLVVLADGAVKLATYEPEARHGRGAWMVRFLVDRSTPEGTYEAQVLIEYADGRTETRSVKYVVDNTPPVLRVSITASQKVPNAYTIMVTQVAPPKEADARRVEVQTPDGQTLELVPRRWGDFRATWQPASPVSGRTLRVVAFDQALNHSVVEAVVP